MLFYLAIFIPLFAALLYGLHCLIRGSRKGQLIDKIPGPYAWPFIGNAMMFLVSLDELWDVFHHINKKYYPIYRIWSGPLPVVKILHPDDVGFMLGGVATDHASYGNAKRLVKVEFPKILLIVQYAVTIILQALLSSPNHIEKAYFYKFLHPWLGTGLLTSTGAKWSERRKILTSAFHFDMLQQFVGVLTEKSQEVVESLDPEEKEIICDLIPLLHKYTISSICETAMGGSTEMNQKSMNEYRSCVDDMGHIIIKRFVRPWLYLDWMFTFTKIFQQQVRALKVLHGFSSKIIKERKQYHEETGLDYGADGSNDLSDSVYFKGKRRMAMLDLLISASKLNKNLDDGGIREEVDTFVFEGHDTTASALCFALLLLAENKESQDRARAEVDALLEEKDVTELSVGDIARLTYLERCLKESLRLFPSVPLISRSLKQDLQLKNYLVPGGTMVELHILDIHRDPNFWPNPDVFDPDRFLPENSRGRHPFSYVPFSGGPRNCIGQKFAMLEVKVLVANVLKNFYLEPIDLSSDVRIRADLILRSVSSIRVKFVRRSHVDN